MKKINFNKEWNFILENQLDAFNTYGFDKYSDAGGAATRFYEYNNWEIVDLPHDWTLQLSRNVMADAFSGGNYWKMDKDRYNSVFLTQKNMS